MSKLDALKALLSGEGAVMKGARGAPVVDRVLLLWRSLPTWAKWVLGIFAVLMLDSIRVAWGERNFVSGVAESFVAEFFYYSIPLAAIAVGLVVGTRVFARTQTKLVGWLCGVLITLVLGFVLYSLTDYLPAVSWRMQAINNSSCNGDRDGRADPNVCE